MERPAAELVEKDLKEFCGAGVRFAVAQIETVDRTRLNAARLKKFADALRERRQRGGWEFAALIITDDTPAAKPLAQYLPRDVADGDTLSVTFWLGRQKGQPGGKAVAYFDVAGTKYSTTYDTTELAADSWKSHTLTHKITNSGNLSLGFYGTTKEGSWLDTISDVTVKPKSP